MKKLLHFFVFFSLANSSIFAFGQGANCGSADPFCTGTTYTFPNNTGVADLGSMDCLGSSPNPAWYYLQIASPGNLDIFISQVNTSGVGIDVDFDLWGPFTSVAAGCTALPSSSSIDCSYSTSPTETANIVGAATGEFYLLLLTNYSNQPGTITFSQTGGLGTTDCSILCSSPNASAGAPLTLTCTIPSVTLAGNSTTAGVTYSWTGPGGFTSSAQNPTVTTAGTYTVTVTDPANAACPSTATQVVNASVGVPNISTGSTLTLTCTTSSVNLTGGSTTGGVTYSWSGPGGYSSTSASPTGITVAGTYTLIVTDPSSSCTATSTQLVSTNTTPPNASAGTIQTLTCTVLSVSLSGLSTTPGTSFSWTGPGGFTSSVQNPTGVSASGIYSVTVTDPANGCTSTSTQNIISNTTVPDIGGTGTSLTLTCVPPTLNLLGTSVTPGVTYNWSGPGGFSSSTPGATVSVAGTYTLTITDPVNGCTSTGIVTINPSVGPPNASVGSTQTLTCIVTSLNLSASSTTSAVTYNWTGSGIVSGGTTTTPTVNTSGTYTVTITDPSNGCTSTAIQTVNTNTTPPIANAGADLLLSCTVTTISLDGSGSSTGANYTYSWTTSGGSVVSGATTISPAAGLPGNYTVTVTDITNGCTSTDNVTVTGDILPVASFTATPTIGLAPLVVDFTNVSTGAVSYVWNFGDGSSSVIFDPSNTYNTLGDYTITLTAMNSSGCTDTYSITIHVDQLSLLTIPNVFTPNGDGENDIFRPIIAENLSGFKATIFDRWGLKIYEWADVNSGWNGQTKSGAPANDGTYYYIINGGGVDGKEYIYNGYLQLLRVK